MKYSEIKGLYLDKQNKLDEKLKDITKLRDFKDVLNDPRLAGIMNSKLDDLKSQENDLGHSYRHSIDVLEKRNITLKRYLSNWYNDVLGKDNTNYKGAKVAISLDENNKILGIIMMVFDTSEFPNLFAKANLPKDYYGVINLDIMTLQNINKLSITFARDIFTAVEDVFKDPKNDFIFWTADTDNPSIRFYQNTCRKWNGKIHDINAFGGLQTYLILREDYLKIKNETEGKKGSWKDI